MPERIGFVSTRFAGTDGVSLESAKWAEVLLADGHASYWYGGRLCRDPESSLCIPEAHFAHCENEWIAARLWGHTTRNPQVTERIGLLTDYLKGTLYEFVDRFGLTMLVLENAVSIPMHVPLGVAIAQFLMETRLPAIAHHHDFYWERTRYSLHSASDYLDMAFPPRSPRVLHVTINQAAQEELSWRKGVSSTLIPNVFDFERGTLPTDEYARDVREAIGLAPGDVMILQPTRVVPRKGIEHAIKLVQNLGDPRYKLVVSHESGDEGEAYHRMLQDLASDSDVDVRFVSTRIGEARQLDESGRKVYTLWDLYPHAAFVTYPSLYEGFGNALLEAMYFRIPVLINRYPVFARDIEPLGFRFVVMDGVLTRENVEEVRRILEYPEWRRQIVDNNYGLAKRHYSYALLRDRLGGLVRMNARL